MNIANTFLIDSIKRLEFYKGLGDKTLAVLNEDEMHFLPGAENNNIAIIIQHMHGNMLSRWTDFLKTDGEKDWRKRDAEFVDQNLNKQQVIDLWQQGWQCFLNSVTLLNEDDLEKNILIRGESLTVVDAILRQLMHYSYHVGQIISIAKIIKKQGWQSLSIPKGESNDYKKSTEDEISKK